MALAQRQMRLTAELVARVARPVEDPGEGFDPAIVWCTDADREEAVARVMATRPAGNEVWLFAYGSLIWNPAFESIERRIGVIHGWHRAFCLGWIRRFRGSPQNPGLMMALDRGGEAAGAAYLLTPEKLDASLVTLFQREMRIKPEPMLPVWARIETAAGPITALTFVMDSTSPVYVGGLSAERIADVLAMAVGPIGSMADYLYRTVRALEDLGIDDAYLWQLQEMVAERIEAANPPP